MEGIKSITLILSQTDGSACGIGAI